MFDNQNFFLKQERVNGSGIPPGIVNIDRVNADELDATSDQIAGRILGQVGMMLEVFLAYPKRLYPLSARLRISPFIGVEYN